MQLFDSNFVTVQHRIDDFAPGLDRYLRETPIIGNDRLPPERQHDIKRTRIAETDDLYDVPDIDKRFEASFSRNRACVT